MIIFSSVVRLLARNAAGMERPAGMESPFDLEWRAEALAVPKSSRTNS
jgi:hypothetical protein